MTAAVKKIAPATSGAPGTVVVRFDRGSARQERVDMALGAGQLYHAIVANPKAHQRLVSQLVALEFAALVPTDGGLINNLKVWENLVLPASYHGRPRVPELEAQAAAILAEFGIAGERFAILCSALPGRLNRYERRLCAFVRAMLTAPRLLVFDSLFDGLTREETASALRFDAAYRQRLPQGASLHVTADLHALPELRADRVFDL